MGGLALIMKFLLDVSAASRELRLMLIDNGHDVLSAVEIGPQTPDTNLMALAFQERRILITHDKDFGELAVVHNLPCPCIIRLVDMFVEERVNAVRDLIENHSGILQERTLIVAGRNRVRVRKVEPFSRN